MEETDSCCSSRGSSESTSVRKRRQKVEVYREVLQRLKDSEIDETRRCGFEDQLWNHFNRLPLRYALDVNIDKAQDVLLHKKLLQLAHDPNTRPAFQVRPVQVNPSSDENSGDINNSGEASKSDCSDRQRPVPTFSLSSNHGFAQADSTIILHDGNRSVHGYTKLYR